MLAKHPTRVALFALLALLSVAATACVREEHVSTAAAPETGVTNATAISGFH
jgi:hypothetical protein